MNMKVWAVEGTYHYSGGTRVIKICSTEEYANSIAVTERHNPNSVFVSVDVIEYTVDG